MLQHLREQIEGLDSTPTKIDIASIELYFYDPKITTYQVYVRYRAQRRKSLPHFQNLLRGMDKYTPPNRVAYLCVRHSGPDGYVTDEDVTKAMRKVYSEIRNERTGKLEIDAPAGAYKDICKRITRIGKKLGKDMVVHRVSLPPEQGHLLPPVYAEAAQSAQQAMLKVFRESDTIATLTHKEFLAGLTMSTRLISHSPKSIQITESTLQRSADIVAEKLKQRAKNQT